MGIHEGHRQRLKEKFLSAGLNGFDDHQVLELLLFFAIPRIDTNPIAHRLMDRFHTLSGVLEAPKEELMKVEGIGENAAILLKMIPQVGRKYLVSKTKIGEAITSPNAAGRYLMPRFYGETEEVVYMVCLDAKCKVICCELISRGTLNSANVSSRKVVEIALANNASAVILGHNHTSGIALPSVEDRVTTKRISDALKGVEVDLVDHIVVADDDFVSMKESGYLNGGSLYAGV